MSQVLPGGGALHVDRETSFFAADLWMWGVTVRGLSQGYLSDIVITRCPCIDHLPTFHMSPVTCHLVALQCSPDTSSTRNQDLTQMNIAVEFTIDEVSLCI